MWWRFKFLFLTGEVIKHNDFKCIQNEGMPLYRDPYEKGQLIIQFQVILVNNFALQCSVELIL